MHGRGFPTLVGKYEVTLRRDQGVRDDVGVGCRSDDGNHDDRDLEFSPTDTNKGRGVRNLMFVLQRMHEMLRTCTSQEANDIVANSRKNPLEAWRRPPA